MRDGLRLAVSAALTAVFITGCNTSNYEFARRQNTPVRTAPAAAGQPAAAESWTDIGLLLADGGGGGRPITWAPLAGDMGLTVGAELDEDRPADGRTYEPWRTRRGPAYRGDFWRSFGRDAKELPATLWDDTKATFTDPITLVALGAAAAAGIAIHKSGADDRVEDHYEKHRSQLSKFQDAIGDVGGNPGLHFAFAGAMYLTSLANENDKAYETSKALINALAITGLTTVALKGALRTESPNDEKWGWPSGHTSSTFTLATVMHEAYGPWVGVPLYALATYVGYERIDARNHDLSDVISGAIIGIAIGHVVMKNHKLKIFGFDVVPLVDAETGAVGMALSKRF